MPCNVFTSVSGNFSSTAYYLVQYPYSLMKLEIWEPIEPVYEEPVEIVEDYASFFGGIPFGGTFEIPDNCELMSDAK